MEDLPVRSQEHSHPQVLHPFNCINCINGFIFWFSWFCVSLPSSGEEDFQYFSTK